MSTEPLQRLKILSTRERCPAIVDGRLENQDFQPNEILYRRVPEQYFAGDRATPGAFNFRVEGKDGEINLAVSPNLSVNRGKFSDPGCSVCRLICSKKQQQLHVVRFAVGDLHLTVDGLRAHVRHEIVNVESDGKNWKNFAHSAVRIYSGAIEILPSTDSELLENAIAGYLSAHASLVETFDCRDPRWRQTVTSALAYERWEKRGRPFGSSEEDWFEAERQLKGLKVDAAACG